MNGRLVAEQAGELARRGALSPLAASLFRAIADRWSGAGEPTPGAPELFTYALWHRSRRNLPPRPVFVVATTGKMVRVVDLVDSVVATTGEIVDSATAALFIVRDVRPENLTPWSPTAKGKP